MLSLVVIAVVEEMLRETGRQVSGTHFSEGSTVTNLVVILSPAFSLVHRDVKSLRLRFE